MTQETEREQLRKDVGEWQNRCGAHSVARDQLIETEIQPRVAIIQQQRDVMRMARAEIDEAIWRHDDPEQGYVLHAVNAYRMRDTLTALDAALKGGE